MREVAAIIEYAEERDRKECVSLDRKGNQELAQWLLDHPTYSATVVAGWLGGGEHRIRRLRVWARDGFPLCGPQMYATNRAKSLDAPLKTNDNFQEDDLKPDADVESPTQIRRNILDSIKHAKSVAEAYRKILKSSSFDREAKAEIYNAITQLIVKWKHVQSTLDRRIAK